MPEILGRVYQSWRIIGGPGMPNRLILVPWHQSSGPRSFENFVTSLEKPPLDLELDDREPKRFRVGFPGWLVMGHRYGIGGDPNREMLGVFIPERMEQRVKKQLESDFGVSEVVLVGGTNVDDIGW